MCVGNDAFMAWIVLLSSMNAGVERIEDEFGPGPGISGSPSGILYAGSPECCSALYRRQKFLTLAMTIDALQNKMNESVWSSGNVVSVFLR